MLREIGGRRIGPQAPVFVIAEIGLNHGGSCARAIEMVDAAAWAGASAIKLQTLAADRLVAAHCPAPAHVTAASLREFFQTFELDLDAHRKVVARARAHGLAVMSTPFDEDAVEMLEAIGIDAYKIASGDVTFVPLLTRVAATGKPVVISSGMSSLAEIARAVEVLRLGGAREIAALHCVSAYPAPSDSLNLRALDTMADRLRVPVGFSDHSTGTAAALAAVARGACLYERHLVLEGDETAIDGPVSCTPAQLKQLIASMETVRLALGDGNKICQPAEAANVIPSRRALYATRTLRAGERIAAADVIALRPAIGLPPSELGRLVGSVLDRDISAGAAFRAEDIAMERAS